MGGDGAEVRGDSGGAGEGGGGCDPGAAGNPTLATWVRHAFAQSWVCIRSYTRGSGHEARDEHAKSAYRPSMEECLAWAEQGGNVEVLLHESDLLQYDVEQGEPPAQADTILARSASGGYHAIYQRPPDAPRRRWIRVRPGVDVLTRGVWPLPGCRREGTERKPAGTWEPITPPREAAPCPPGIVPRKAERKRVSPPTPTGSTPRARAALEREAHAASSAPEGQRHVTLHRAACNLGQLVASGELHESDVRGALEAAAHASQPDQLGEALRAIDDGLRWGMERPRPRPETVEVEIVSHEIAPPPEPATIPDKSEHVTRTVLVPGAHLDDEKKYREQSASVFADQVLDAIPPGLLYRRDVVSGRVVGARFIPATTHSIRRLCDKPNVRLARWTKVRDDEGSRQALVYRNCSDSEAQLILDAGAEALPEVKLLTSYPVILPDGSLSRPGFHDGVYYSGLPIVPERDPDKIRAHLLDLIVDFPFEDAASRANFLGLLLTPMLRPLVGKVPLHLTTSPQAGTGKSRLIEEIFGATYLGKPLSSSTLPERGEEAEKWLVALLLGGANLLHLDNLPDELDSAYLASILTSHSHSGRVLGSSSMPDLVNTLTVAATGNNTQLSSEIARRAVVIRLIWRGHGSPEERTDFVHPDTLALALAQRDRTLACLAGAAVYGMDSAYTPPHRLGSFERWSEVVGRILGWLGIEEHLGNRAGWRDRVDAEASALRELVAAWDAQYGTTHLRAAEIAASFPATLEALGARVGSATSAGVRVARYLDRPVELDDGRRLVLAKGWSTVLRGAAYWLESAPAT